MAIFRWAIVLRHQVVETVTNKEDEKQRSGNAEQRKSLLLGDVEPSHLSHPNHLSRQSGEPRQRVFVVLKQMKNIS